MHTCQATHTGIYRHNKRSFIHTHVCKEWPDIHNGQAQISGVSPSQLWPLPFKHTHIYENTHTHSHTPVSDCLHTYIQMKHKYQHSHQANWPLPFKHIRTHSNTHTHSHTPVSDCLLTYIHTYIHTYIQIKHKYQPPHQANWSLPFCRIKHRFLHDDWHHGLV
jgi:hypothetical protein